MSKKVYYAIGDIHGEADRLISLHDHIHKWHEANHQHLARAIIHLGDYVDRGPKSYEVVQYLMTMQTSGQCEVINLMGNHEYLMLDACIRHDGDQRAFMIWYDNGGAQTLASYKAHGFDMPAHDHVMWMKRLPSFHWDRQAGLIFVHAGIDPNRFPFENEDVRLWTRRAAFFDPNCWQSPDLTGMRVVHGHTPTKSGQADVSDCGRRINIDTGACYGGPLTAAIFVPGQETDFLCV
ncbi:serine/threonine protein phosphatase [hydrothermal vent metagenome]|uniref:Serine/threonine protein phosphatase n=1 Tax=hydrothermal vent metagenome TaxID=652676 RepID=A0A3B0SFB8_9ZZZZ